MKVWFLGGRNDIRLAELPGGRENIPKYRIEGKYKKKKVYVELPSKKIRGWPHRYALYRENDGQERVREEEKSVAYSFARTLQRVVAGWTLLLWPARHRYAFSRRGGVLFHALYRGWKASSFRTHAVLILTSTDLPSSLLLFLLPTYILYIVYIFTLKYQTRPYSTLRIKGFPASRGDMLNFFLLLSKKVQSIWGYTFSFLFQYHALFCFTFNITRRYIDIYVGTSNSLKIHPECLYVFMLYDIRQFSFDFGSSTKKNISKHYGYLKYGFQIQQARFQIYKSFFCNYLFYSFFYSGLK